MILKRRQEEINKRERKKKVTVLCNRKHRGLLVDGLSKKIVVSPD